MRQEVTCVGPCNGLCGWCMHVVVCYIWLICVYCVLCVGGSCVFCVMYVWYAYVFCVMCAWYLHVVLDKPALKHSHNEGTNAYLKHE